jgi:undecaprenyl-diphosphatase
MIATLFGGKIGFVGWMLLITAMLLFLADRSRNNTRFVGRWDALWIGFAQMVALLPGISRSGATIAMSLFLGIDRTRAARFSFLMVVPLILGKIAYDLVLGGPIQTSVSTTSLLVGFTTAFIAGVLACRWMVVLVARSKLRWFAVYCVAAGAFAFLLAYAAHA